MTRKSILGLDNADLCKASVWVSYPIAALTWLMFAAIFIPVALLGLLIMASLLAIKSVTSLIYRSKVQRRTNPATTPTYNRDHLSKPGNTTTSTPKNVTYASAAATQSPAPKAGQPGIFFLGKK